MNIETAREILAFDRNYYILGCTTEVEANPGLVKEWKSVGLRDVLPKNWLLVEQRIRSLVSLPESRS
jgi:hypothetical protein